MGHPNYRTEAIGSSNNRSKSIDLIKLWQQQAKKLSYAANANQPHASGPSIFLAQSSDLASGQK